MRTVILAALFASLMWGTTLSGTLRLPDGNGATGTLFLSLSQQAALDAGCGGPAEVVPTYEVKVTVTAGAVVGSPTVYGNDCLKPAGTWYAVRFLDKGGNLLFADRWIISGGSIDIGTIQSAQLTGTTQLFGGNSMLLTSPASSQTIAQPSGTTLTVNDLTAGKLSITGVLTCGAVLGYCTFNSAIVANGGISTPVGTNSQIVIGTGGNLYMRTFSGGDANCASVASGWIGIRTDTNELQACVSGQMKKIALQ